MKKVISVVGARPNFIKIAPVHKAFEAYRNSVTHLICHTGQHFDEKLSRIFFDDLEMPQPDFYLGVGSASHAEQTARIMIEFEKVLLDEKPDMIIVPGDVNSTMAASLVASKMGTGIAHIEAGLRSFDRTMPEEINRIVTDSLSDLLFVSEMSGMKNLSNEGISGDKVFFAGNVMIDSLVHYQPRFSRSHIHRKLGIEPGNYILTTFHRPANVDHREGLSKLVEFLNTCATYRNVIFAVHPRTDKMLKQYDLKDRFSKNVLLTEPLGYIEFLALIQKASLVVTDSGGIQEETTFLSVPCITIRDNTERPVTVSEGTNYLAGTQLKGVERLVEDILKGSAKKGKIPELWDGKTAERIVKIVVRHLNEG
ncbi:MAG: UDP-N-acetylglucosamine 2-epimerase (non-hydrolyzing) [Bacteroidales bacterium]|nr:UDP-N-acetylglucosamine 2-epimerase (non-hydrolyzing) [Bacteroidales bacterium]